MLYIGRWARYIDQEARVKPGLRDAAKLRVRQIIRPIEAMISAPKRPRMGHISTPEMVVFIAPSSFLHRAYADCRRRTKAA